MKVNGLRGSPALALGLRLAWGTGACGWGQWGEWGEWGEWVLLSKEVCWSLKRDLKQQGRGRGGGMSSLAREPLRKLMTPTLLLC